MIALGCDHGGYKLKEEIKKYLDENQIPYKDFGTNSEERTDVMTKVHVTIRFMQKKLHKLLLQKNVTVEF